MSARLAAVAVLTAAVFSWVPGSAQADGHHYLLPAGSVIHIELQGSDGYSIRIASNQRRRLILWATKAGMSTEYEVQGEHVGAGRVKAKLPGLGLISVRFFQHGPTRHPAAYSGCDGPRPTVRRGVVRGAIRFTGEGEYTRVDAHTARAETVEWARQRCRYGTSRHHRRRRNWTNFFEAFKSGTYFSATKYRPGTLKGGDVVYDVTVASSRGHVQIFRHARVIAPASTFQIPEPRTYPEHVILSPPAPFVDTGTFSRTPESVFTWGGDLSVQFPGVKPISLTGRSFYTSYCALQGCIDQSS